jgi:phosphoribosylformylglycinamidine synthase
MKKEGKLLAEVRFDVQDSVISVHPTYRIEVQSKETRQTRHRQPIPTRLYFISGAVDSRDVLRLTRELLVDPVTETYAVVPIAPNGLATQQAPAAPSHSFIEVTFLPGVTDTVAQNLLQAAHRLGMTALENAATGLHYRLDADIPPAELTVIAEALYNPVIQRVTINTPIAPPFVPHAGANRSLEVIPVRDASDDALLDISSERRLALDLAEMQAIRTYFQQEQRDPTDAELEMLAQTWSEHCVHKTFRAAIDYTGPLGKDGDVTAQHVDGLLKTYIRAATERINKPWVHSAFVDNAGIIAFDDTYDVAFKVETHNHPSALEPFGGANTGLGGVIRDVLGVSARPIASTDVFCFGMPDTTAETLPAGVLPPDRVADGVIHGIEDYGNKMGIPTVNGAVFYHPGYTANPLVFAGSLGLLPRGSHPTGAQDGDYVVVLGGRTGRDGLRGATFSSMGMDVNTGTLSGSAVQIGHPIQEKQVLEVILRLRDEKLYSAITDCGAGGLSSAVGEMASGLGAHVRLETVPLKYAGLAPWEIWLSEAQERMVLAIPPQHWERALAICAGQNVEACAIGTFEATGRLRLMYDDLLVGDLSVDFLHEGLPRRHLQAEWNFPAADDTIPQADATESLLALLAHPNIRSKEAVIRRYDHEVQGSTVVKPLVGVDNHGPADASVVLPHDTQPQNQTRGVALSAGMCPQYSAHDPYAMAFAAIDEAFRNLVAVGADPDQVAILDNFCWGNPKLPDRLGALVRCSQGCYDGALAYNTPFISGKDSLNNEYADENGQRHAIPGTLLISAVGIVPNIASTTTSDLKQVGNRLYVVGSTRAELGGSHYAIIHGATGGTVPQPVDGALNILRALYRAISTGTVCACHDLSEGGLAVALAEMAIGGRTGLDADLSALAATSTTTDTTALLFSESITRFVVEVAPDDAAAFEAALAGVPLAHIGSVTSGDVIIRDGANTLVSLDVAALESAWRGENALTPSPYAASGSPLLSRGAPPSGRGEQATATFERSRPGSGKRVLVLHANGTNRDRDAALACELAGAEAEIVHVNQLLVGERTLADYHMLVVPGGFSYGDDLGAGRLWAVDLQHHLDAQIAQFVADGRPVLGICNGFQTLVKAGLLPGSDWNKDGERTLTLTYNEQGRFECRWVLLEPNPNSPSVFTRGLTEPIYCPVAHGEGRLMVSDAATRDALWNEGLAALVYAGDGDTAAPYPLNPNGSTLGIAGLCNRAGNVFGLMPHPENHVFPWQHPRYHRGERGLDGLRLFENGLRHA